MRDRSLRCRVDGEVESQFGVLTIQQVQVEVKLSPVIRLTLDPETRRIAHIHERAVGVAFMHPMETEEDVDVSQLTVAEQAALRNGAFAMFSAFSGTEILGFPMDFPWISLFFLR